MVAQQFQLMPVQLRSELKGLRVQAPQQGQSYSTATGSDLQSDKPAQLLLLNQEAAQRHSLQQFIAQGFHQAYGADVQTFMPDLLAVQAKGQWQAVLGIRSGQNQSLFVEQYLDADICTVLHAAGINSSRDTLVEIGNLYSANRQYTLLLFVVLAYALYQLGYRQLVCCATSQVQDLLQRHGLELTFLAEGDASRLGDSALSWGSYYQSHPKVCALDLTQAMTLISSSPRLLALPHQYWPGLHATVAGLSLEQKSAAKVTTAPVNNAHTINKGRCA